MRHLKRDALPCLSGILKAWTFFLSICNWRMGGCRVARRRFDDMLEEIGFEVLMLCLRNLFSSWSLNPRLSMIESVFQPYLKTVSSNLFLLQYRVWISSYQLDLIFLTWRERLFTQRFGEGEPWLASMGASISFILIRIIHFVQILHIELFTDKLSLYFVVCHLG